MLTRRPRARQPNARLPIALTPLLGRTDEIEELTRLLATTRLLTITGAGGSGKTRLALELAQRARAKFEDFAWVELAPIDDAELVAQQILDTMGVRELAAEDVLHVVIDTVRERKFLFILDNCEHLVASCAVVAEEILRNCPNAVIVTTTREALGIGGEQTWLVPPLSEDDALLLFRERARSASPAFEIEATNEAAVRQICRRLDGIPLAVELAAARVKHLAPAEIAVRLDDVFSILTSGSRTLPRHRTIRETIDWSYRLLTPAEQDLLQQLAVFAGTFTLVAVESICGPDSLESLSTLVDKSLVIAEGTRFRMIDAIRQFAEEKLEESGRQPELRRRHARHYVAFMEELEPRLFAGAVDPAALNRVDQEIGNIRAIFDWNGDPDLVLRLLHALHWYWFARGHFHEARKRLTSALGRGEKADPLIRAKAIIAAGNAAVWQADWASLRPDIDEAVATIRAANDLSQLANALLLLAIAEAFAEGDYAAATATFDEAVAAASESGRDVVLALTLYWRGLAAQLHQDWQAARASFEEAYEIGVKVDNKRAIAHPLTALGYVALHEGQRQEAIESFRRALDLHAETDDRFGLTQVVEGVGQVLLDGGDAETGTRLLAAAAAAWMHLGARPGRGATFEEEKSGRIREALGDDRLRVVLASGAAMSYDAMVALARDSIGEFGAYGAELKVRALGELEILRDGEPLDESARSRELLLFLLCHPAGATKDQIGAALWPDADPAKLRNNFHVTLHRLRKVLGGAEWVTVDDETYTLDRKRGIDFDAEVFEREAGAAMRARSAERIALAVELYRGDFYDNATEGEWHQEIRDRLRDLYARCLDTLARLRILEDDYPSAADAYRKLVALDELDEEAARGLIQVLEYQGDHSGAVRVWERLARSLRRELGVFPSFEKP